MKDDTQQFGHAVEGTLISPLVRVMQKLESEHDGWWELAECEMALGGNCVKEATYRGTATGLKIALNIAQERLVNRNPD